MAAILTPRSHGRRYHRWTLQNTATDLSAKRNSGKPAKVSTWPLQRNGSQQAQRQNQRLPRVSKIHQGLAGAPIDRLNYQMKTYLDESMAVPAGPPTTKGSKGLSESSLPKGSSGKARVRHYVFRVRRKFSSASSFLSGIAKFWNLHQDLEDDESMAVPAGPPTAKDSKGLSGPALRTFFRIAELWNLSVKEQKTLLGINHQDPEDSVLRFLLIRTSDMLKLSLFETWKKDPNVVLPRDTLERISCIVGVYKALQILLPDKRAADEWVKRPNAAPLFSGRSALDRMLSGQVADLLLVRQYLDAQCGGWA